MILPIEVGSLVGCSQPCGVCGRNVEVSWRRCWLEIHKGKKSWRGLNRLEVSGVSSQIEPPARRRATLFDFVSVRVCGGPRIGAFFAALLVLALSAACVTDGDRPPGATQTSEAHDSQQSGALVNGVGLLWRIDIENSPPSYVFGTMHLSDPRIVVLPPPVDDAFRSSVAVGLENISPDTENPEVEAIMRLPDGRDLEQIIGPDMFEAIYTLGENQDELKSEVRTLKPWAVAMLIEKVGRDPTGALVLDDRLESLARKNGKTLFGLETAFEVMEAFDRLPEMHQIDLLRATLIDIYLPTDAAYAAREAEIRAYLARETGWLAARWNLDDSGEDTTTRRFRDHLLNERSNRFAERMLPWIDKGGAFVAVGSGHLPGEQGVIARLQARGYEVTRVY
ncbi:MAG: TraB/GumN family protein [Alphaproteobacteria bacterium]|nr:TraB/GumN family protein [Alphaproteobacteria bacterium]